MFFLYSSLVLIKVFFLWKGIFPWLETLEIDFGISNQNNADITLKFLSSDFIWYSNTCVK